MKTIRTKALYPSNSLSARIKAHDGEGNSVIVSYPYDVSDEATAHFQAYVALQRKMGWGRTGEVVVGIPTVPGSYVWLPEANVARFAQDYPA